uniref:Uncharacterized protein n=1 Tax=Timema bartmani TaxID=61472 RepID=A0A7R9FEL1_9NEOP|nr:unnamed protein product [Timema bartmani]
MEFYFIYQMLEVIKLKSG